MAAVGLDLSEIFEEAYERAGLEIRSGYDLKKARRCFNILTNEWANRGLNLWTINEVVTLAELAEPSITAAADTIDILQAIVRDANDKDFNVSRIKLSEWASKNDKETTGMPSQMYITREADNVYIRLWPIPDIDYTFVYWRLRYMDGLSSGGGNSTSPDLPIRFIPALISGLAYHVAQSYGESSGRVPFLQGEYERQFDLAAGEDRERASVRLVPRIF